MDVGGWLEMLVVLGIVGMDEGMVEGREEDREEKGDRPG